MVKPVDLNFVGYSNATYTNLENGLSQSGFIIFVAEWTEWILYAGHQKYLTG